jgi:signal peptidase I
MFAKKPTILIISIVTIISFLSCQDNAFKMSSTSMEPTIKNGEIISADLSYYENQSPVRGDIILFHSSQIEGKDWTMRIVGLPGEVVSYDSTGLLINGKLLESYKINEQYNQSYTSKYIEHPYRIPDNGYYVLGDNFNDAYDSRFWGAIDKNQIFGKVLID